MAQESLVEGIVAQSASSSESSDSLAISEVIFARKAGMALTYNVIQPREKNGAAVIFVVSGGWNSHYFPPEQFRDLKILEKLHDAGYILILMRHGSAPLFKVPDAVSDIRRGVRHVRSNAESLGFSADRLAICGASAGGHLSLMIGTTGDDGNVTRTGKISEPPCRVACVAAYFPPTDLRDMVGPSKRFPALDFDQSLAEAVSPIVHVSKDDAPTLLVHGTQDRLVPLRHSERIKKQLDEFGVPCELLILEGAGHGFVARHAQQADAAVLAWFQKHLLESKNTESEIPQ